MIINIIGIVIGILIFFAGIFYCIKEKADKEAIKIYTVTAVLGAIVVIGFVLRVVMSMA